MELRDFIRGFFPGTFFYIFEYIIGGSSEFLIKGDHATILSSAYLDYYIVYAEASDRHEITIDVINREVYYENEK